MSTQQNATQDRNAALPKRLITIAAAAEYADVHVRTIRRWLASGHLTGYRLGPRLLRIDADELHRQHLHPVGGAA
ncbi:excisionase family DNA-binding protein [Mycolicibacterium sp. XJ2546]